jgi:hypothetical protein
LLSFAALAAFNQKLSGLKERFPFVFLPRSGSVFSFWLRHIHRAKPTTTGRLYVLTIGRGESFTRDFGTHGGEFHPLKGESFTQNNFPDTQGFQQFTVGETLPFPAHRLEGRGAIAGRLGCMEIPPLS